MKTSGKIALGVLAGLGIAASAAVLAHGHGPMGHGPEGFGPKTHCKAGGPEARLETLKSELKLTAKQEKAWQAFEQAVRKQSQAMTEARGGQHAGKHDPDAHIAFMEQRLAGMKEAQKARTGLYKVLTPEQKAVFDRHGPRGRHG